MRDTIGLILLEQGKDPANFTDDEFDAAIDDAPEGQGRRPAQGFTGNDYTEGLTKGDIAACIAWTGDVMQLQADNANVQLRPAGGRPHAVDRQHGDPERSPSTRRTPRS